MQQLRTSYTQDPFSQGHDKQHQMSEAHPPTSHRAASNALSHRPVAPVDYGDRIAGAVLFDNTGFPHEYFICDRPTGISWEQTVFQVLGLRGLLMSSLRLEGFRYAKVSCCDHTAFIIRKRENYMALLLTQEQEENALHDPHFLHWLQDFEVSHLRTNPRFQVD
jgi:hypothetical protein